VNALDLTKIAKAFGFKVPPRVNLAIGPGKGQSVRAGEKRRRDEESGSNDEEDEEQTSPSKRMKDDGIVRGPVRSAGGKAKRIETLGRKAVEKEKYRKGKLGTNWSR